MLLLKNSFFKNQKFKGVAVIWHIVAAMILAIFLISSVNPGSVQAQSTSEHEKFLGSWIETRESGTSKKRAVFKIMKKADGSLTGYTNSPDRGYFGEIPISGVTIRGDSVILNIKEFDAQFKGKMKASNSKIKGQWISGENSSDWTLVPLTKARKESLPKSPEARRPKADPEDVKSPEAIVNATYKTLSGKKGEKREWDRFRSLFLPGAQIVSTSRAGGVSGKQTRNTKEYINEIGNRVDKVKFHIKQLHSVKERFGDMAHVFSTYEESGTPISKSVLRGLHSYQLWYDGERWWIYSMLWHSEREDAQIPQKYLGE